MSAPRAIDGGRSTANPGFRDGSATLSAAMPPITGGWLIYAVTDHSSGRQYVGLTTQSLEARFLGHRQTALRRKVARSGSLGEAIRARLAAGLRYAAAFSIRLLDVAGDPDRARQLETDWIARLGSSAPAGFNLMPGGSSLGGVLNSVPVTVRDPDRGTLEYPSLSCAIRVTNKRRGREGRAALAASVVYARLELGWTIEEALGLAVHVDGRGRREPFIWRGQSYDTLREVEARSGIPLATLRSRLHRNRHAVDRSRHDLARDRRRDGIRRRLTSTRLPSPDGNGTVSLEAFASRTGIAKSSVLHRYHHLVRSGRDPATMPRSDLHAFLTERQDRRIMLELEVRPGIVWQGGVRELTRRLFADWVVECWRPERVSEPTIRARLRRTTGWPDRMSAHDIRIAFGFEVD